MIEPVFFWPDALMDIHHRKVEAGHLRKINGFADNPVARAAVDNIRTELKNLMSKHGAAHLQIGKTYAYQKSLKLATHALLKAQIDPKNLINPGALGL